jgi:hypothetical protein
MEFDVDDADQFDEFWSAWDIALMQRVVATTLRRHREMVDSTNKPE